MQTINEGIKYEGSEKMEGIVQLTIKEYNNLKYLSEATNKLIEKKAKEELIKLQSQNAIFIKLKFNFPFKEKLLILYSSNNLNKELETQLNPIIKYIESWLNYELTRQYKSFDYIKKNQCENIELHKFLDRQIKFSFFGWLGFGLTGLFMLIIILSYFICK